MLKRRNWAWLRYGLLPVLLTLFLSPAMAEGYGLFVAGVEVTSENCSNLGGLDGVTLGTKGELKYDPVSKTLTMIDVTMNLDGKQAVRNESVSDFKIVVAGNNQFTVTKIRRFILQRRLYDTGTRDSYAELYPIGRVDEIATNNL